MQRKILDGVRRGLKLVVLQQDYTSGRYPLDWFPKRPVIVNANAGESRVFDPAGALGLEKVECEGALWQPIRAHDDWEVFGNGGLARCKLGQGEIWLCQARLMQNMFVPGCARNLKKLLELGGREKPVVVVDAGSEGNRFSTSVFCDFMNAHDIPFLTLGEVIVAEQGMDSFKVVPGIASADRVLKGRGPKMVHDWLASRMRAACLRPVPATPAASRRSARGASASSCAAWASIRFRRRRHSTRRSSARSIERATRSRSSSMRAGRTSRSPRTSMCRRTTRARSCR
jgi:hypothetical protein